MTESQAPRPHRCFVSVELPFLVSPHAPAGGAADVQRTAIEAFVPPAFLAPCLTASPATPADVTAAAALSDGDAGAREGVPLPWLGISDVRLYHPQPVFTGWRPAAPPPPPPPRAKDGEGDDDDAAAREAGVRAEVFPSLAPQLLLHGYCHNDLLVRVVRRRRVRRRRDCVTGATVELSTVEDPAALPTVEVVGVVAREVQVARPADFCHGLFTSEQQRASPHLCGADVFPPAHFLCPRALTHVPYHMGAAANTSVGGRRDGDGDGDEAAGVDSVDEGGVRGIVPSLTIAADDAALPPPPLPQHAAYLRHLGCSEATLAAVAAGERVDDDSAGVPVEVRVVSGLLANRPVWLTSALAAAVARSGLCPGLFTNKQVIMATTYAIARGPFNRLRIRMGYDPYASARASAVYQRVAVRLPRRSEVGLHVRELSRSPHLHAALAAVRARHAPVMVRARERPYRLPGDGGLVFRVGTLIETFCQMVQLGALYAPSQFAEMLDDELYRGLVEAADGAAMPLAQRARREGWLSPLAMRRALAHFTEALAAFLREEVVPAVRALSRGERLPDADPAAAAAVVDAGAEEGDEGGSSSDGVSVGSLSAATPSSGRPDSRSDTDEEASDGGSSRSGG